VLIILVLGKEIQGNNVLTAAIYQITAYFYFQGVIRDRKGFIKEEQVRSVDISDEYLDSKPRL
jgi:hypothetical protein